MPYEELSLLAQLNCDADFFANSYLRDHPTIDHMTVHQFPAGECVLQLRQGTITRDIKNVCAEARNLPALMDDVTKKNNWATDSECDLVDWPALGQALKRHRKHHSTLVKYIHNMLPLGKQVHRYDKKYPPNCPTCYATFEDIAHFWRCQATTPIEWRWTFLRELKKKLITLETRPQVREFLLTKIRAVHDGEDPTRVPEDPILIDICSCTEPNQMGKINARMLRQGMGRTQSHTARK